MPKYFYICENCQEKFSFFHGMSEIKSDCEVCHEVDSLVKVPTTFHFDSEKNEEKKIGSVVRGSIDEFRDDLEQQKNKLKKEIYTKNE